jgi:hypothetical protein
MKNNLKYLLLFIVISAFTACEEDALDPLSGTYSAPVDYTLDAVIAQNAVKGATTRTFTLELGSNSQYLSVDFVSSRTSYFLVPGAYTIAAQATAKSGNYVAGQTRWVTSGASLPLTDGTIVVALEGDAYTISGTVILEDQSIIRIAFSGVITFEVDPPVYTYKWEMQKPYAYTTDGTTFTPVAGSQLNKVSVFSDGIPVAYFEIVTEENRTSLAGTYLVSGMITDVSGAVVRGSYVDLPALGWGTEIIKGGSYLMEDTEQFLFDGNLTIVNNTGTLTLTSSNFSILDITSPFYAPTALPGVVKSINYVDATLTGGNTAAYTYTLETSALYSYTQDGQTWITVDGTQLNKISVFAGSEQVGYFEVISAPSPASLAGAYELKDPVDGTNQIAVGSYMNMSWFGGPDMVIESGSYYVENGEKMFIRAGSGGVMITITDASGVLGISGTGLPIQDVTQMYWALLPDPGSINYQNVTPADSSSAQLELPNLLSVVATDLAAIGAGTGYTVTLKLGEAGVTATPGAYGITIGGTGKYISIDFKQDAATLPAGTYNIVDNATAATGDAIAGYYLDLGFMGFPTGCFLVTVAEDVEGIPDYLTGGTVTVAEAGGAYTVTVNATTEGGEAVQAVFTGAITIQ